MQENAGEKGDEIVGSKLSNSTLNETKSPASEKAALVFGMGIRDEQAGTEAKSGTVMINLDAMDVSRGREKVRGRDVGSKICILDHMTYFLLSQDGHVSTKFLSGTWPWL
jgi:hypothetical protein